MRLIQASKGAHVLTRRLVGCIGRISIGAHVRQLLTLLESLVTFPVFLLSWMVCGLYYAALAGRHMAAASSEDKNKLLDAMFGQKKPNP